MATYISNESKVLHGLYEEKWDDGTTVTSGYFENNLKVGLWREKVNQTGFYNQGVKHGAWKTYKNDTLLRRYNLPIANKLLMHGPSGCGKTLASYVIAGELNKMMVVVNLGAIVSSKLGETSKNLAKIFRRAAAEDCIIFIDEFDSLGKVRDYSQDHGEMKRVVNTILQPIDYLPQNSIVIAATNQKDMLDDALLRRFDFSIEFGLPNEKK